MLNLAPYRYAAVLASEGGPIDRISLGRIEANGEAYYRAGVFLSGAHSRGKAPRQYFGSADGSGTDKSALLARYKAISEGMERWAYHAEFTAGRDAACGLDLDPTSSGMAAFPGLWKRQARLRARREAVERWCLVEWWAGRLNHRERKLAIPGIRAVEIENPLSGDRIGLLWGRIKSGLYAYGWSAGRSLEEAFRKALIERHSCTEALSALEAGNSRPDTGIIHELDNELERRVVYFSLQVGWRKFRDRLDRRPSETALPGNPVFDREIPGPWSRYATVWRMIYPTSCRDHHDPQRLTFFW